MKLKLYLNKSIEENASIYYDKAKKLKKKIEGAKEALHKSRVKLNKHDEKEINLPKEVEPKLKVRKKEWFLKFRWFYSSEGFLCIGGRDSTTNEIIIKKYTDKEDLVLHTDMSGSPFFIIKSEGKEINEKTLRECADATCCFSRGWKLGYSSVSVFYVKPEQVTKEAKSGEYLNKGSFIIKGKTNYIDNNINLSIGLYKTKDYNLIMAGPNDAVKKHCKQYVIILQGEDKASDIAKKVKRILGDGDLDEIIRALPSGGIKLAKEENNIKNKKNIKKK